jgi:hypothetical protein
MTIKEVSMWPIDQIKGWMANVALKKVVRSVVGVAVAFLLSTKVAPILQQLGVTVNPVELEAGLTAVIAGGLEWLRTTLKAKFKLSWL